MILSRSATFTRTVTFTRTATACLFLLVILSGCRPASTANQPSTANENTANPSRSRQSETELDPKTRLREVFRRYQGSSYYQDDGMVVLQGPGSSNSATRISDRQTETAPLRVRLDQRGLFVDAYTARIRVLADNSSRSQNAAALSLEMLAWFDEPETSHFDAQVLRESWRSSITDRIRLERVLADEVLRSRLSAGLAGPPPQLEWLLADDPMKKLFDPQSQFEWLSPESIAAESSSVQRIAVTSARQRFVFWIAPDTSLIRRVELPVPEIIAATTHTDLRQWSLRLELNAATFAPPQSESEVPSDFELQPSFTPKIVRQFVPLPPSPPSPLIGKRIDLRVLAQAIPPNKRVELESLQTMLVAIPPSRPESLPAWIQTWQQTMPALASPEFGSNHLFVITSDRLAIDSLRSLPATKVTPIDPRRVVELTRQMRLAEGSFGLLAKEPQTDISGIVLLSETVTTGNTTSAAITVVGDHHAGVNVPSRIREDYESIVNAYEARLKEVAISTASQRTQ